MWHRSVYLSLSLASSVFAVAACKGDKQPPSPSASSAPVPSTSSSGGPPGDLCKLATKSDVEKAFGGKVSDGESTPEHCRYAVAGTLKSGIVVNDAMGGYVEISWNEHVMTKTSKIAAATMEAVLGFDNAWYLKEGHTLMVEARQGELSYQGVFSLATPPNKTGASDDVVKAALIELATATYSRPS